MKHAIANYTFNAAAKTLTFNRPEFGNNIDLTRLLLITDVTTGAILYQFNGGGVTVAGNVLTFTSLPGNVQSSDTLQILYDLPVPEPSRVIAPDTSVLSDDWFDNGLCGWQEYAVLPTTWANGHMPVTLGTDGNFGRYAMRLTTANVPNSSYGGIAIALKRMTHQSQPGVVNKSIVKQEYWFTYGSDGVGTQSVFNVSAATFAQVGGVWYVTLTLPAGALASVNVGTWINVAALGGLSNAGGNAIVSSVNAGAVTITYPVNATPSGSYTSGGTVTIVSDLAAPHSITFLCDTQTNGDPATQSARGTGNRAWFGAAWIMSSQSGGQPSWSGQWQVSQGSGVAYGAAGYTDPISKGYASTGYYTDFCPNQNLRNLHYVALTMDVVNGAWLSLQANDQFMDLTACPGNGGLPLNPVTAPGDPSYNLRNFSGGVNQYIQIYNLTTGGAGTSYGTAAWLELHRARMSYV